MVGHYVIVTKTKKKKKNGSWTSFFPHRILGAEGIVVVVVVLHLHGALALRRHHHRQAEARWVVLAKLLIGYATDR